MYKGQFIGLCTLTLSVCIMCQCWLIILGIRSFY